MSLSQQNFHCKQRLQKTREHGAPGCAEIDTNFEINGRTEYQTLHESLFYDGCAFPTRTDSSATTWLPITSPKNTVSSFDHVRFAQESPFTQKRYEKHGGYLATDAGGPSFGHSLLLADFRPAGIWYSSAS